MSSKTAPRVRPSRSECHLPHFFHEYITRVTRSPPGIQKQCTPEVHRHFQVRIVDSENLKYSLDCRRVQEVRILSVLCGLILFCFRLDESVVLTISRAPRSSPGNIYNRPSPSCFLGDVRKLLVLHPTSLLRCVRYQISSIPIHSGPTWTPPQTLALNPAPTRTQPLNPHNEQCASRSSPAVAMGGKVTVKGIIIMFIKIEI